MDDQQIKTDDQNENRGGDWHRYRGMGRLGAGLFLLLIGGVLLLDQMGFPLPDWLFRWYVIMIAAGLFIGFRHNFRGGSWLAFILIGGFFFIQDNYPNIPFHRFIWPAILIFIGMLIIISPRGHRRYWRDGEDWGRRRDWGRWAERCGRRNTQGFATMKEGYSSEDFIDATAIFGGVHKKVVSKNFKGGDVTSIMGGTELDLTQADFTGVAKLEVTQIMGATKIIVPPHWEVRSEVTALFAGYEDKRQQPAITNPDKLLILHGTSVFGGIELKNY
ncbi:MAG TPA: LiaF domain-containing protein [Puia sp.]|nr:LiaF domain-containing protein [Puia sp.]